MRIALKPISVLIGFAILSYGLPSPALAHGGGLDKDGCHTNRKTGEYHCHRGGAGSSGKTSATPQGQSAKTSSQSQVDNTCYTGPRGGRYRIVNGKKRYDC